MHLNARQMGFRGMATIGVTTYLSCLSAVLAQVGPTLPLALPLALIPALVLTLSQTLTRTLP